MILNVPYRSQLPYENGGEGERQWCGVVSLWMVLSFYLGEKGPSVEELLQKYGETLVAQGFRHKDFLQVARDCGLRGFRKSWWVEPGVFPLMDKFLEEGENEQDVKDWMETNVKESIFTIKRLIDQSVPVIVSVTKDFSPSHFSHLVVVVGYKNDQLVIHDPLHRGANFQVSEEEFISHWIRQAIVIRNK